MGAASTRTRRGPGGTAGHVGRHRSSCAAGMTCGGEAGVRGPVSKRDNLRTLSPMRQGTDLAEYWYLRGSRLLAFSPGCAYGQMVQSWGLERGHRLILYSYILQADWMNADWIGKRRGE